ICVHHFDRDPIARFLINSTVHNAGRSARQLGLEQIPVSNEVVHVAVLPKSSVTTVFGAFARVGGAGRRMARTRYSSDRATTTPLQHAAQLPQLRITTF